MEADHRRHPPGFPMRPPGIGMAIKWECFGCKQPRYTMLGSKGIGIRRRCKQCVEAKA